MRRHTALENIVSLMIGLMIGAVISAPNIMKLIDKEEVTVNSEWYGTTTIGSEASIKVVSDNNCEYNAVDNVATLKDNIGITDEEYMMLAKCVEAEAGSQDLRGKQLVVDVILNRVLSDKFPNSVAGVISQGGQFTVYSNGSMNSVNPSMETYEAINLECDHILNTEIMFFKNGGYHTCGKPAFKEGDHYFNTL